jgi:hypothetical protein
VALALCLVIVFNISLPQTRKDSIVDQLSSQVKPGLPDGLFKNQKSQFN